MEVGNGTTERPGAFSFDLIEHYHPKLTQLGVVMNIPAVEEPPFYNKRDDDALSEEEKQDRADAYRAYRENLRTGTKPDVE